MDPRRIWSAGANSASFPSGRLLARSLCLTAFNAASLESSDAGLDAIALCQSADAGPLTGAGVPVIPARAMKAEIIKSFIMTKLFDSMC
jgi:hypothetical protein